MSLLTIALILLLAVLLQGSALPPIPLLHVQPGVVLLVVVGWGFLRGGGEALAATVIGGLLLGLQSSAPLGAELLALLPVAFLLALAEVSAVEKDLFFALAATFVCTILYHAALLLILQSLGQPAPWLPILLRIMLPSAVVNTLAMPFIFWFLTRVRAKMPIVSQEAW